MLLPLYLTKVDHNLGFDVMAYNEPEMIWPVARWTYDQSSRPDHRNRYVTFNCYRWQAVWLN